MKLTDICIGKEPVWKMTSLVMLDPSEERRGLKEVECERKNR